MTWDDVDLADTPLLETYRRQGQLVATPAMHGPGAGGPRLGIAVGTAVIEV